MTQEQTTHAGGRESDRPIPPVACGEEPSEWQDEPFEADPQEPEEAGYGYGV